MLNGRIWLAVAAVWGAVLILSNSHRVPGATDVSREDVYAEMSPASQSKLFRLPKFRKYSLSPLDSRPATNVEGHQIVFRDGLSVSEQVLFVSEFRSVLSKKVADKRNLFVLRGMAWWAVSLATFFAFAQLLGSLPQKAGVQRWHPGKLILLWLASGAFVYVLSTESLLNASALILTTVPGGSNGDPISFVQYVGSLLLVPVLIVLCGVPTIGTFVVTWTWLSARESP